MTTPAHNPVAELHAAAELLREAVEGVAHVLTPWTQLPYPAKQGVLTGGNEPILMAFWGGMSEYVARLHPGVAAALADWLDREAAIWQELETAKAELHPKGFKLSWGLSTHTEALAVARAILGEVAS